MLCLSSTGFFLLFYFHYAYHYGSQRIQSVLVLQQQVILSSFLSSAIKYHIPVFAILQKFRVLSSIMSSSSQTFFWSIVAIYKSVSCPATVLIPSFLPFSQSPFFFCTSHGVVSLPHFHSFMNSQGMAYEM